MPLAVKIAVYEYERGWGSKLDDYMVCLSVEDAQNFATEFNAGNTESPVPDWYMCAQGKPVPIDISDAQFARLQIEKRIWLKNL